MNPLDNSLSLLLSADSEELAECRGAATALPARPLVDELLAAARVRFGERIALVHGDIRLTYDALWQRIDLATSRLRGAGAQPGRAVAIALPPGIGRIVAVVATLRSGACWLPLNPDYPVALLRLQYRDAADALLVGSDEIAHAVGAAAALDLAAPARGQAGASVQPGRRHEPGDAAYVIHTSGSSGTPKGCVNTHTALYNRLLWMRDALHVSEHDCILHKTAFGFDVSVWEQLLPLISGARLVLADVEQARDGRRLAALIEAEGVTLCHFVPTLLDAFLEQDDLPPCPTLRALVCSGEALSDATARRCRQRLGAELYNYYGPTEAAIDVTAWRYDPADARGFVPIGRPIDNVDAYPLRNDMSLAPEGAEGELYLGGVAVGAGYLGRARQTAERFVPDPFSDCPGARLYRTGDIVRRHPGGVLEYVGRRDGQVKLRGYRIELGEIESTLRRHPAVAGAAVVVRNRAGTRQLAACVVPAQGHTMAQIEPALRAAAALVLPPFMVPTVWIGLARLPATVNGKLDRPALARQAAQPDAAALADAPSGATETLLTALWQELLGAPVSHADANFFASGGDSILAIRLVARARSRGLLLEVNDVFDHPTLRALSACAERAAGARAPAAALALPPPAQRWSAPAAAAEAMVGAVFVWPHAADGAATVDALDRLDALVARTDPARGAGLRLAHQSGGKEASGVTLRTLARRLAAAPAAAFAAATQGDPSERRLLIALPPRLADWHSLRAVARVLADSSAPQGALEYRTWALSAAALPAPSFVTRPRPRSADSAGPARVIARSLALSAALAPAAGRRRAFDAGVADFVIGATLQALAEAGVGYACCSVADGRQWARGGGWDLSQLFGRLECEHELSVALAGWHCSGARLSALHLARTGIEGAPDDAPAQQGLPIRFVVVDASAAALAWAPECAPALAQAFGDDNDLAVVAVIGAGHIELAFAGGAVLDEALADRVAQLLAGLCARPPVLRTGAALVGCALPPAQPLAAPLADAEDAYPLAPMQAGMLLRASYWPDSDAYFNQNVIELRGRLDRAALTSAWLQVVARYEALRCGFLWEGLEKPLQYVAARTAHGVAAHDWDALHGDEAAIEARLQRLLDDDREQPFDMRQAGLWRFNLVCLGPDRHFIVWSHHHILLDGWCLSLIWGDVFKLYEANVAGRPPALTQPRPYRDYLAWLAHHGASGRDPRFWRDYLDGFDAPTLFSRHGQDREGRFDTWRIRLSEQATAALSALARATEVTPNAVIQAAWSLLLGQHTGTRDTVHGVAVSGRPPELEGVDQMVGLYINTIPLRLRHHGEQSVASLLRLAQQTLAQAGRQAYLPLAEIAAQWRGRRLGSDRLFDSLIAFENYPENNLPSGRVCGLEIVDRFCDEKTEYPLGLIVLPGRELELHFNFDTAHFGAAAMQALVEHYRRLLDAMVAAPDAALATLPGAGAMVAQNTPVPTRSGWPSLDAAIGAHADLRPDAAAVVEGRQSWTYAELDDAVDNLARGWRAQGVAAGDAVLLVLQRGRLLLAAVLALWRIGAVPALLNPAHPASVRGHCAALAGARRAYPDADGLPGCRALTWEDGRGARAAGALPRAERAGRMILFTSGTTGDPKGVLCREQWLIDRIEATWALYTGGSGPAPRLLANAAAGFDIGLWEFFYPLAHGGTVIIASARETADIDLLAAALRAHAIDTLHLIPSMLDLLLQATPAAQPAALRCVISGGETLAPATVRRFFQYATGAALWQGYGPTEAAVSVADHRCLPQDAESDYVPLGRATGRARLMVLDAWLRPVGAGVPGELFIGGEVLFDGYLGDAAGTARARLPDPWGPAGAVLYRTGDRAVLHADGRLEFRGRHDRQLKLRGQRIDLGMLEQRLARHPAVRQAAVVAAGAAAPDPQAHVSLHRSAAGLDAAALRAWMSLELPYGLVLPVTVHDALPLTATGKLDRRALAQRPCAPPAAAAPAMGPRNATEAALWRAWTDTVGRPPPSRDANFFEEGGHSLAAMRLVLAARRHLAAGGRVEVTHVFKFPTVAGMAEAVSAQVAGSARDHVIELGAPERGAGLPLFLIHPVEGMSLCYRGLRAHLGGRRAYAFNNPRQLEADKFPALDTMARLYVEWVRGVAGDAPVILGGWSFGGVVALEMARQMRWHGGHVERVLLIDSYNLAGEPLPPALRVAADAEPPIAELLRAEISHNTALALGSPAAAYDGAVVLLQAAESRPAQLGPCNGWARARLPRLRVRQLPGTHHRLFDEHLATTAAAIVDELGAEAPA